MPSTEVTGQPCASAVNRLFGPLDDALCSPVRQRQGMPPRVSLDTSSRASRKVISKVNRADGEPVNAPADNSFTSALDVPPRRRRRPAALRRRGSDGDSPRYRDSSSHHDKYPSMDSPTEPHPLRRASTTARTARYETGNTRPRLSRILSPSTPVLVKSPLPADFPALPDKAEGHRTVLAHEVLSDATFPSTLLLLRERKKVTFPDHPLRILPLFLGLAERFSRRRRPEIRYLGHRTAPCQSALGIRLDSPPSGPLRPPGQGTACRP